MSYVNVIRHNDDSPLTLFEVQLDGDETPYRVWDDTEEHARVHAQAVAVTLSRLSRLSSLEKKLDDYFHRESWS